MVYASIQGKEDMSKQIVVENGKLVEGVKADKVLTEINEKITTKKLYYDGKIRRINKSDLYCFLNHPEKDIANRKRIGLVIWDENEDKENIRKTINAMGLDVNQWEHSYETYKNEMPEEFKKKLIIGIAVAAIVIIAITIIKG